MNSKQESRLGSIWWIAVILLGALLTSQCGNPSNPTPIAALTAASTPDVSDLCCSSNELLPGDETKIWVNVKVGNPEMVVYTWSAEDGKITRGQEPAKIIYRAPDTPGDYEVSLKVEYGEWRTERSKSIVIVSPTPTPTSTSTSTPTPTNTPSPTNTPTSTPTDTPTTALTFTPTPIPPTNTPTVTPTPTLLPPPIPLEPENGAAFLGGPVILRWQWDYRPRAPNEIFSLRVRREGETEPCHHYQPRDVEYWGDLTYCSAGNHYWNVALVRDLGAHLPEDERWKTLSESSEERWIYYVPGDEPWTWPTPDSGGGGGNGGGTGELPPPP